MLSSRFPACLSDLTILSWLRCSTAKAGDRLSISCCDAGGTFQRITGRRRDGETSRWCRLSRALIEVASRWHEILQARILEWIAIPFSRRSSILRGQTQVSCIAGRFFTIWATREAQWIIYQVKIVRLQNSFLSILHGVIKSFLSR